MKNLVWILALLFSVSVMQSCQKDEITEPPVEVDAPELPKLAMFTMPTSEFDPALVDTSGLNKNPNRFLTDTYFNWFHAAINLVVWHTVVALNTAAPIAAFQAAFYVQPVFIGNLTFEWAYDYTAPVELGGHTYNVSLTGQWNPDFQEVYWEMHLSQEGGYTDFLWYTGTTSVDNNTSQFSLNHQPYNPQNFIQLDYQGDESTGEEHLRFTNIIPSSLDFGDYIEYHKVPGAPLDRGFNVLADPGNLLEIQWHETTKEGRVRHEQRFGDTDWHCWDGELKDVVCD